MISAVPFFCFHTICIMKKLFLPIIGSLLLAACSSAPDGIDEDAWAPYSPVGRMLICNTTRGTGISTFSAGNNCLFYEFNNKEDTEAMGGYQRVSETKAHALIISDDVYETEYILEFDSPEGGQVEEHYTKDNFTEKHQGTFSLR